MSKRQDTPNLEPKAPCNDKISNGLFYGCYEKTINLNQTIPSCFKLTDHVFRTRLEEF